MSVDGRDDLAIRPMAAGEAPAVARLVLQSFRASVAATHSPESVAEFERLAAVEQLAARAGTDHDVLGAARDGTVVGMVERRGASRRSAGSASCP